MESNLDRLDAVTQKAIAEIQAAKKRLAGSSWEKCKFCGVEYKKLPEDGYCQKCFAGKARKQVTTPERDITEGEATDEGNELKSGQVRTSESYSNEVVVDEYAGQEEFE